MSEGRPQETPRLLSITKAPEYTQSPKPPRNPTQNGAQSERQCTDITLPQLGESVTEGTIGMWLKEINEHVDKYDPLVEVETDKVNTEIPSPLDGTLVEICVQPQTTIPVGTKICRICEENPEHEHVHSQADNKSLEPPQKPQLLEPPKHPESTQTLKYPEQPQTPKPPQPEIRRPITVFPGDEIVPLTPLRRVTAERVSKSEREAPLVTAVFEVDMTNVVNLREKQKEEFKKRESVDLTYLPFAIKAAALALRDHPRLNAVFDEDKIIHRKAINIGIAVGLEDGLIIPVIKNADRLSLTGLAHEVSELSRKAKEGTLKPDDVTGGTFTINNPGTFGSISSTPIPVWPQVAILSTEAIVKRPVVIDDSIAIRSMMNLSMSFDHRALDGLAAARFLQQTKRWLEHINEDSQLD